MTIASAKIGPYQTASKDYCFTATKNEPVFVIHDPNEELRLSTIRETIAEKLKMNNNNSKNVKKSSKNDYESSFNAVPVDLVVDSGHFNFGQSRDEDFSNCCSSYSGTNHDQLVPYHVSDHNGKKFAGSSIVMIGERDEDDAATEPNSKTTVLIVNSASEKDVQNYCTGSNSTAMIQMNKFPQNQYEKKCSEKSSVFDDQSCGSTLENSDKNLGHNEKTMMFNLNAKSVSATSSCTHCTTVSNGMYRKLMLEQFERDFRYHNRHLCRKRGIFFQLVTINTSTFFDRSQKELELSLLEYNAIFYRKKNFTQKSLQSWKISNFGSTGVTSDSSPSNFTSTLVAGTEPHINRPLAMTLCRRPNKLASATVIAKSARTTQIWFELIKKSINNNVIRKHDIENFRQTKRYCSYI
uniref:Uncharacterized protein n=1 Tax=Romanomermis culicivorax TaxID=13658 RepID=A0A915HVR2_ROMCU